MPRTSLPGRRPRHSALAALLAALLLLPAAGPPPVGSDTLPARRRAEARVVAALDARDWPAALQEIDAYLVHWAGHPFMLYNRACVLCRLGRNEEATTDLLGAVRAGFREFDHLRHDPDLASIRDTETFQAILAAADRTERDRAEALIEGWKAEFGAEGYRFEIDEVRRLVYATALDDVTHREMRAMLDLEADQLAASLFGPPPAYYVLVAIPTPRHADRYFNGDASIGGQYVHAERRLVARDVGVSLRHEFVHARHYGHMERLRLTEPVPIWILEGLATLYETVRFGADGTVEFLPNERTNIVRNLEDAGRLTPWSRLLAMPAETFMRRATRHYPEVRAIFEFLADRGALETWYATYVEGLAEDRSGRRALEATFGLPMEEIERRFRDWVALRDPVDLVVRRGEAALGVEATPRATNDGVLLARVLRGGSAERSGLRRGDVIVAVDGEAVRSLPELQAAIGEREVGDSLLVRFRRDATYLERRVVLRPLP